MAQAKRPTGNPFAPPGSGGQTFYPAQPCRVLDTRRLSSGPLSGAENLDLANWGNIFGCYVPAGSAYVLNSTVVPVNVLGYLTLWPTGQSQPLVSTLNALDGAVTSNMAIVPGESTSISVFASDTTNVILDLFGYFAP